MRKTIMALSALALAMPVAMPAPAAHAQSRYEGHSTARHRTGTVRKCRRSKGRTGLIAGGVIGVLAGPAVLGHGLLGAVAGGAGGALGGRAIDRSLTAKDRCHAVKRRR
ncbi:hypothetical protein ACX40Y_09315 [Sphingomonas sp. RS6]